MPSHVQILELDPGLTVLQALAAFESEPFLLLLDSAARHRERDSRYSILTSTPVDVLRLNDATYGTDPFDVLRNWQQVLRENSGPELRNPPPFHGGIAGLLSYELGHAFERLPPIPGAQGSTPVLLAGLFDWAIVWDHMAGTVQAFFLDLTKAAISHVAPDQRIRWVRERLALSAADGDPDSAGSERRDDQRSVQSRIPGMHRIDSATPVFSNFTRTTYLDAVNRVIEYIRAGDIFQANLSQQLSAEWAGTAAALYANVRERNPAPFCGLLVVEDFAVISASPERFLKISSGNHVETRPIKGTRRRHRSPVADLYSASELIASAKDRAENVMIVDLLRNDLSRSCSAGSVRVTGLCELERFETVLHLVSTVEGRLRPDCDVWDLLAGSFPGGSITGAPKIRAMEIISELEQTDRGPYCGSLFALGPRGDFDSSILIRTFTLRDGVVTFPVGGGIVADSNPLEEYRETLHKASGMLRCLQMPVQG